MAKKQRINPRCGKCLHEVRELRTEQMNLLSNVLEIEEQLEELKAKTNIILDCVEDIAENREANE